jgi:hypothetical protein
MTETNPCEICSKPEPCDEWVCRVEMNRREGCPEHTPNNLPIRCIRADGMMLEHEHGDHPDYLFPVEVEYVGPKDDARYQLVDGEGNVEMMDEGWKYSVDHEEHALLYTNGSVAITIYETCSAMWSLLSSHKFKEGKRIDDEPAGLCMGGHLWLKDEWKLTDESLQRIAEHFKTKLENGYGEK